MSIHTCISTFHVCIPYLYTRITINIEVVWDNPLWKKTNLEQEKVRQSKRTVGRGSESDKIETNVDFNWREHS